MRVVAGVISDSAGDILLTQRPQGKHLAGLWEFPGGKIEAGESEVDALKRELKEELSLEVSILRKIGDFPFKYPTFEITLIAYFVMALNSPQTSPQVEVFRWVSLDQISPAELAPADIPVLASLLSR